MKLGACVTFTTLGGGVSEGVVWSPGDPADTWWLTEDVPGCTPVRRFVLVRVNRGDLREVTP